MNDEAKKIIDDKLYSLSKSSFRSSFHLKEKEKEYIQKKGYKIIKEHAKIFVEKNLAPALPKNDGKQTPMKNHPVFIAQHATATCCRSCLEKWHNIPKGKKLSNNEQNYIITLIMEWIKKDNEK